MEFTLKRILGITYIIIGFVWCILHLPNLMARANGKPFIATALGVFRVIAWPLLVISMAYTRYKSKLPSTGDSNDTETTAD